MTYKYHMLRRTMFENNPARKLNSFRSFSDIKKIFRLSYLIISIAFLIALFPLPFILMHNLDSPLAWILTTSLVLIILLVQNSREKYVYKESARSQELLEEMCNYKQYISDVRGVLEDYGIDTPEKVMQLKAECEMALKMGEDKFTKMSARVADMLIGVPLGALIAGIIYAKNDVAPEAIAAIILTGFVILAIIKLFRIVNYYLGGYFKDKYLLDAITELNYNHFENTIAAVQVNIVK